jgi:hypothetical protein
MAAWTTPRDWVANELIDETLLNAHIRDNVQYLYDELPIRATLWHDESVVTAGNALTTAILATQPHNYVATQSAAADADSFTQSCVLGEGTYTLYILGETRTAGGKVDWTLDGASIATGQDWYSASNTPNVIKSIASIVIATGGRHILQGTINGKNASSSGYTLRLTKFWFVPSADS